MTYHGDSTTDLSRLVGRSILCHAKHTITSGAFVDIIVVRHYGKPADRSCPTDGKRQCELTINTCSRGHSFTHLYRICLSSLDVPAAATFADASHETIIFVIFFVVTLFVVESVYVTHPSCLLTTTD